jgi:hypothetical protein
VKSHAVAEPSPVSTAKRPASAVRSSRSGLVQTKLAVNSPGDAYEHEADRAADAAVRTSPARPARPISLDVTPLVQRAPTEPKKDDEKPVQKKDADSSGPSIALDVPPLVQRAPAEPKKDDEKPVQKKDADSSAPSVALGATSLLQRAPDGPKKDDEKPVQKKAAGSSTHSIDLDAAALVQRARAGPHEKDDDDDDKKRAQKKAADPTSERSLETMGVPARVEAQIGAMSSGGESLPRAERAHFEDRFGYDFRDVRVHSGAGAAQAASALNARAFTVGQNIFFASGEYQPGSAAGRHLVAHELTHTIQQSAPAARAARMVQRDGSGPEAWARGKVHDWAIEVPGYKLLTGLIGSDPITDAPVTVTDEELIHEGLVEFVPDGEAIFQKLQADKTITQFLDYFHQQWAQLNLSWSTVKAIFQQAWDDISSADLLDPAGAWEKVKAHFGPPLDRLKTFIINVGGYVIDVIKKKVLEWLRDWGTKIPGYPLLTFILGKDPFTDEIVPRTPTTFVKAALSLVPGGDKIFDNLQKSHTIERTVEWLNQEIIKLDLTWEKIKALFSKAWDVISTSDLLNPIGFVDKIRDIFEAPAIRVVNFAIDVGKKVLEFIFEGVMMLAGPMGQRVVGIFQKASASFSKIVADPVAFLGHLLDAVVLGFKQFVGKIGEYLEAGVIAWLTGALQGAGITLPKVWDLQGILSLVLQILGITYEKMRAKIVKALGDKGEQIVSTAEKLWNFLSALMHDGPAAAWQKISEAIGNFWNLVIGGIKDWAIVKIIKTAVTQLVTLFNPVGAVIEAIIETYRTIEFFVKKINQIVDLVEAIVNSIANIAAGQIAAAATYVEKTLARTIPVIIGFLASLVGLDDVSEGIRDTIEALQQKVDQAIDAAIAWIVAQVKALFGKDEGDKDEEHDAKWDAAVAGVNADIEKMEEVTPEKLEAAVPAWKETYGFSELKIVTDDEEDTWEIDGAMSEGKKVASNKGKGLKLTPGTTYLFFAPEPDSDMNPRRGKYVGRKKTETESLLHYTAGAKENDWYAKPSKDGVVPLFAEDAGTQPKVDYMTAAGRNGEQKALGVNIDRTVQTPYISPSVSPYGWNRFKPGVIGGKYVRGHILNGQIGGPSNALQNLTPITNDDNVKMRDGFEEVLREGVVENGYSYTYQAYLIYWEDSTIPDIPYASDFPEKLVYNYQRLRPSATGWEAVGSKTADTFEIDAPDPEDLRRIS